MRLLALAALLALPGELAAAPSAEQRRREIATTVTTGRLTKLDVRPALKAIFPSLRACYERELARTPRIAGVINTRLTIRNDPGLGMTLTVHGFDTDGALGGSREFLACVTRTFEAKVFPPIAKAGMLDLTYPGTFDTEPPGARDKAVVDRAVAAAKASRWSDVLAEAERGLRLTSLDGPLRRRLIELGGLAACHSRDELQARRYYALASPELEHGLEQACATAKLELAR